MAFAMCGASLVPAPLVAQDSSGATGGEQSIQVGDASLELGVPPTREQELEAGLRDAERRTLAAGLGLTLSVPAIVAGAALFGSGLSRSFCVSFGNECPNDDGATAMQIAGPLLFVAGLIGTGFSGRALRNARKDKRRFEDELRRTTVRLSPTTLTVTHRF